MRSPKSTPASALFFILTLLVSCNGVASKGHAPMVFALNLSSAPVSLALVKDGQSLVSIPTLAPGDSRSLMRLPASEGVALLQGDGGFRPARQWTDPSGSPYNLRFQDGQLFAIVVDPLGQAALYSLSERYTADPKVCIVNVTNSTLSQVQAAPAWAKNVKIYAQDVVPAVPSEFYSIEPKTLGLYWQTLDQVETDSRTTAQGFDGKPLRMNFESGHYYLFLAGEGAVRDVTPTLD